MNPRQYLIEDHIKGFSILFIITRCLEYDILLEHVFHRVKRMRFILPSRKCVDDCRALAFDNDARLFNSSRFICNVRAYISKISFIFHPGVGRRIDLDNHRRLKRLAVKLESFLDAER